MKIKEHVAMPNTAVMKSPGLSSVNLSLKNLCFLGCSFALIMVLISAPYLQSSFTIVIDEGKSSQMIQNPEASDGDADEISPSTHSEELTDSKIISKSHDDYTNNQIAVKKRLKSDESSTTTELEGQSLPDKVSSKTPERTSRESSDLEIEGVEGPDERADKKLLDDEDSKQKSADTDNDRKEAEFGNHRSWRESPHLTEEKDAEIKSLAPDQELSAVDADDGSASRDSETVLRQKTSEDEDEDEDTSIQLLSPEPSQMIANSSEHRTIIFNATQRDRCDIFKGHWIPDPLGPLYSSDSCGVLSQAQNCRDNGRPDHQYEFYRWKPQDCDLPRLHPLEFLEFMKGKTVAFIGDSVARNQFESLMCILSQVEQPKNRGNKKMQRWYFPSHKFTLVRIWSGWLVRQTKEPFSFAPEDSVKLFLDELDEFAESMSKFSVAVISSGHWWVRQTAYILDGKIRGGYGWKVNVKSKKIDQSQAFAIGMKNVLKKIGQIPNYTGLTILRTYSPDHYQDGLWNTGGSCTGKTQPFERNQLPRSAFNEMMRSKQMDALKSTRGKGSKRTQNGSSLALLDVFEALNFRADGHPGPYRNRNPNKRTERDEKGNPPPQDCLHWCMPGPVDTMNQLLFEVLRRELQN